MGNAHGGTMGAGPGARRLRALVCIIGLLALQACAIILPPAKTVPGVANAKAWRQRQADLADARIWSLQGRAASGKILGWTGNLSWREHGDMFHVRVSGPLGAGGFRADGTLQQVRIRTKDQTLVTEHPEQVVAKLVGWKFPLTGLRYWVLGLPNPNVPAQVTVDRRGLLVGLKQSGWQLTYPEYTNTQGQTLPRRIVLYNGDNTIKVVIDRWLKFADAVEPSAAAQ